MPNPVDYFDLTEIAGVRIKCLHDECGAMIQMSIAALADAAKDGLICPGCRKPLGKDGDNKLLQLAAALESVWRNDMIGVEVFRDQAVQ